MNDKAVAKELLQVAKGLTAVGNPSAARGLEEVIQLISKAENKLVQTIEDTTGEQGSRLLETNKDLSNVWDSLESAWKSVSRAQRQYRQTGEF